MWIQRCSTRMYGHDTPSPSLMASCSLSGSHVNELIGSPFGKTREASPFRNINKRDLRRNQLIFLSLTSGWKRRLSLA
jgi:hypothetical protein